MIINNLQLFFDRVEGEIFLFKTATGQQIAIDKKLLENFDAKQKLFLNLDSEESSGRAQDILNEILETNND
ncbi:MAG: hypothetical protein A2406_00905 [Candidatus Komeilibacteria bacterium RIFOXYC1_FULL_37_11]|uniref:DUF3006 domain-containing protein n=1 Tax=Candidatus Komeilibacteria bacterium RIFOXYC1_FULL_37_11 TaxID=1798555 RepID=A0A1G2BW62_9BACT|nr:MAG: hypothetical protein A2406_00905 [Candidatus Komeilibacteria bacterium RIFOXYC1_FULL_37_11]OGY95091.1 MAG: hypothetical protein A2611_00030 [Candidatus Komeilibacteria bacterium RIFOXYD1_FULL_37_29]